MAEITDDDILETAERLARELALDEEAREVITLAVQRLVWPPSPHYFLHEDPHIGLAVARRTDGKGWTGELRCPGCGRVWMVHQAGSGEAAYDALTAAHTEYRTGRVASVARTTPVQPHRRMSLGQVLGQAEYVEVQDRRMTS